ncbi:restriction endonuclease [Zymomonas mobilis]|uniref:restriction endonuclease n=1 Tax=Zymomonas mobilis TaxID=542 RepID=UPI00114E5206|nr:restriction endonuclease [Zymomonas mobilis]
MSALSTLLETLRQAAVTEREKGTYFEELIICYLRTEPRYVDLYDKVWTFGDWAREEGHSAKDTGIDLIARTRGTGELHAIQCKFYAPDHKITKKDIDTFFSASGKSWFSHRIIVATTNHWNSNAEDTLGNQYPPVSKIDLLDLETSIIDWSQYHPKQTVALREKKKPRDHQKTAIRSVLAGFKKHDRGRLIMACGMRIFRMLMVFPVSLSALTSKTNGHRKQKRAPVMCPSTALYWTGAFWTFRKKARNSCSRN